MALMPTEVENPQMPPAVPRWTRNPRAARPARKTMAATIKRASRRIFSSGFRSSMSRYISTATLQPLATSGLKKVHDLRPLAAVRSTTKSSPPWARGAAALRTPSLSMLATWE